MISKEEMVRLLLSDATYTLPDVDYTTQPMINRLTRMRTNMERLHSILDAAPTPEEKQMLEDTFREQFPGFDKKLIKIALNKIKEKLPPAGGSKKKRKRKTKRNNRTRR